MRGMTDHMTIGQRVAFYRRRHGLSQEVLAGLVGKTAEWLRKVETNRAELDRLSVIRSIAKTLDVSLADLIGEPSLFDWSEESGRRTIPALRAALHDYRHLAPVLMSTADDEPPSIPELQRDVTDLWNAYQRSRYASLARCLPYLIHDCLTAAEPGGGSCPGLDWRVRAGARARRDRGTIPRARSEPAHRRAPVRLRQPASSLCARRGTRR